MKGDGWPTFSFAEALKPPEGWKTDCAILTTYSADLVAIVAVLLSLSGCDLENRRTGSRVELVRALEALRGRVCVLAQAGRVVVPDAPNQILKLFDKFVKSVQSDETAQSWHPKAAFIRYHKVDNPKELQWRVWLGSRNLTCSFNWEAGLVLASRPDARGIKIDDLASTAEALAQRAKLPNLKSGDAREQFERLTWDCPPGCEVKRVRLFGPGLRGEYPVIPEDTERLIVVSPFLDRATVLSAARWGGDNTRRVLLSISMDLQRLLQKDPAVFQGYHYLQTQPRPDLPAEGADIVGEDAPTAIEIIEGEDEAPTGLHAKLIYAAKGKRRQLWLGSANATARGWTGRNFEIVAELTISRETALALEDFVASCPLFIAGLRSPPPDRDEEILEKARNILSARWSLRQRLVGGELEILASTPPPISDRTIQIDVATLDGAWMPWPRTVDTLAVQRAKSWQRTDFLQIRVIRGKRKCAWIQFAPCEPPPDEERDRAIIGQYLDPQSFLAWLRSLLADEPTRPAGGDWDAEGPASGQPAAKLRRGTDRHLAPTVEEILRSWARDPSAFKTANAKVQTYLTELERRAEERTATEDTALLRQFRSLWMTLSSELL